METLDCIFIFWVWTFIISILLFMSNIKDDVVITTGVVSGVLAILVGSHWVFTNFRRKS